MGTFVYPPYGNFSLVAAPSQVNLFDKLVVTYNSTWSSLNLTLFCLQGTTSTSWQYWNVVGNPIVASGTYTIPSIESINFSIYQFPTNCKFKLTKYGDNNIGTDGQLFEVVSVTGISAATYQMTASTISSTSSTSTSSSQSTTSTGSSITSSSSTLSTRTSSTSSGASLASSTSTGVASTATNASSGLSTGAKAGIGVGVGILVLLIAALSFLVLRQRRKLKERQHPPHTDAAPPFNYQQQQNAQRDVKPELYSQSAVMSPSPYKTELDSQQTRVELDSSRRYPKTGLHEMG